MKRIRCRGAVALSRLVVKPRDEFPWTGTFLANANAVPNLPFAFPSSILRAARLGSASGISASAESFFGALACAWLSTVCVCVCVCVSVHEPSDHRIFRIYLPIRRDLASLAYRVS